MKKYEIDKSKCTGCGACIKVCPHNAIKIGKDRKAIIDEEKCQGCNACIETCPFGAIKKISEKEIIQQKASPTPPHKPFLPSEDSPQDSSFFSREKTGRGRGAGRGRGLGLGPQDGRGKGMGRGGRNR